MKQRPFSIIRHELAKDPRWAGHATQADLAMMVGRSTSLIKNVENGVWPMSAALAKRVSERLGIDEAWLMAISPAQLPIPAVGGGPWSVDMIPGRLRTAIEENLRKVSDFMAESPDSPTIVADMLAMQLRDRLVAEFRGGRPEAFLLRLRQLLEGGRDDECNK